MVQQPRNPRPPTNRRNPIQSGRQRSTNARAEHNRTRFRNFVFTLNNPTEDERDKLNGYLTTLGDHMRYIAFQTEQGEGEGTTHIQGYIELTTKRAFNSCKAMVSPRAHIERRRGSAEQAADYALKEDTRVDGIRGENGTRSGTGNGKSLQKVAKRIKDGASLKQLSEEFPVRWITNHRGMKESVAMNSKHRNWAMEILIFYGTTGSGKSYLANKLYPEAYNVPWPTGGRWWWPNYDGEETVVLDEFRHQIKMDVMLKLFDRYAFNIEQKGSNMKFRSKRLVITTNIHPKDWYLKVKDKSMLERRFKQFAKIYTFTGSFDPMEAEEPEKTADDMTIFRMEEAPEDLDFSRGQLPPTRDRQEPRTDDFNNYGGGIPRIHQL